MHLHLLEVDPVRADGHGELLAVARAVVAVRRRQVPQLRPVLLQQRALREVRRVAARREDHGPVRRLHLAVVLVLDADDRARLGVLHELRDARLLLDLHALRGGDREVLEALHLRVRDDHAGELRAAAVCPGTRLAAEARDLGEVEPEAADEPVDGVGGAAGEHADEVVARELLRGALGVLEEDLGGVLDPEVLLRDRAGAVDA